MSEEKLCEEKALERIYDGLVSIRVMVAGIRHIDRVMESPV